MRSAGGTAPPCASRDHERTPACSTTVLAVTTHPCTSSCGAACWNNKRVGQHLRTNHPWRTHEDYGLTRRRIHNEARLATSPGVSICCHNVRHCCPQRHIRGVVGTELADD
jgi:hypothetical protein